MAATMHVTGLILLLSACSPGPLRLLDAPAGGDVAPDVLVFDEDRDGARPAAAGYESRLLPLFAVPAPDGRSSDRRVEGGIKGDGAVGELAPRLESLLR
jgi:hypothetical protein